MLDASPEEYIFYYEERNGLSDIYRPLPSFIRHLSAIKCLSHLVKTKLFCKRTQAGRAIRDAALRTSLIPSHPPLPPFPPCLSATSATSAIKFVSHLLKTLSSFARELRLEGRLEDTVLRTSLIPSHPPLPPCLSAILYKRSMAYVTMGVLTGNHKVRWRLP